MFLTPFFSLLYFYSPVNISGIPEATMLKFSAKTDMAKGHFSFEPKVDQSLDSPRGEAPNMEQISEIT